ncbi:glycosyltransferase family 10 domain-containing protein [Brevundimonas sp.]|uniref:glycosyltransferase family 10 domain-containing protein n=1 Tax=Brevundimonas sp. TaxID=1871086 RepID=UPI002B9AA711|nr:glycosyltransferase family 10 [Brevundimonas sp.]HWQ88276.1 glycosyltransferase family 10 [Brevundimonas sp.]
MTPGLPAVNILHCHGAALFPQHFDPARDGYVVIENGDSDREWDLVVVFETLRSQATYKVREGGLVFISGEPPEVGNHSPAFLRQFDTIFSAGAPADVVPAVFHQQHFNNWHFGYSASRTAYRYDHRAVADLAPPAKSLMLSTVTSNLNYLPMHIKRRALVDRLAGDYADRIDFFGRPHNFVEYKEDAILPYRFQLCIENCSVPDLWTEKIADALLGYAIPIYAGCPNIERYFPGATIAIDIDDYASVRRTIDAILADGEALYQRRFDALVTARQRLIRDFDISTLIGEQLGLVHAREMHPAPLVPEADLPFARLRDLAARAQRKVTTFAWRRKVAWRG